jgi:hypothetical protein
VKDKILARYRESASRNKPYGWMNYQPINLPGYEETLPLRGRDCFDRSEAILAHMDRFFGGRSLTICDWGSNLGFFAFEAAKRGHIVQGRDSDARFVDICSYLAKTNSFQHTPSFQLEALSYDAIKRAAPVDVLFCFSVLHHIRARDPKEAVRIMQAMAERCRAAYIEMDGNNYGRYDLELFFWKLESVVSTNDRYGSGRKHRETIFCANEEGEHVYRNIKTVNLVHHRGVFARTGPSGAATVIKRERVFKDNRWSHTWIKTTLEHEREIYEKYPSPFFPKLLGAGEGEFRWIEIEYIQPSGNVTPEAIDELFRYLEDAGLFIIDLLADSFIPADGSLKMVDLESVFPVEDTVAETIRRNLIKPDRPLKNDTYEKQKEMLKRHLCRG